MVVYLFSCQIKSLNAYYRHGQLRFVHEFDLKKQRQNMGIQGETVVKREWEGVLYVPTYLGT